MNFLVLGAGSWGLAIAKLLVDNGHKVTLWHYRTINKNLSSFDTLDSTFNLNNLIGKIKIVQTIEDESNVENIICTIPSSFILDHIKTFNFTNKNFINCSKGFSHIGNGLMSQALLRSTNVCESNLCVLSGPNHAEEVVMKMPTASVLASTNKRLATKLQASISNDYFRIYTSSDVIGVEVGACLKNVIAIASGICFGLDMGDNTVAALLSRSLEEIKRIGLFYGADPSTFNGLSGLGDLVVTAFSKHSRNRMVGIQIAKGKTLDEIKLSGLHAEGISATKIAYNISQVNDIVMPITEQVYCILYKAKDPRTGILELMRRDLVSESAL